MVVLLAVGVCERVQFSQEQRVFQHSLDWFDQVRLQRGRMLLFGVALVQKRLEGCVCFCWRGHKHRKMWLCCHSTDRDRTIWRWAAFVMLFTIQHKMFSSTLSSLTYWKTLLRNHHKSAESTLNSKNSQWEEADQPHRHPHRIVLHTGAAHMRFTDPQVPGSVKIPELTGSKVAFELRFTYLWPALWALWCGWHRKRCRSWSGRRNTGTSRPEKRGFSVRREGFWEKYIRYHGLRWINLVMNACEWCTTTVVSQKTWYYYNTHTKKHGICPKNMVPCYLNEQTRHCELDLV